VAETTYGTGATVFSDGSARTVSGLQKMKKKRKKRKTKSKRKK
jgi:hypothetical protein|tara:strand:+ start:443 stop:571 length:129 start_codon:yes stop_codon:yes gene_type:complete